MNITFIDNRLTSGQANAIYIDSVQSYDKQPNSFCGTFCWNGWFYINNLGVKEKCTRQLRSGPAYYRYGSLDYTIDSGDSLHDQVQLTIHDAWGNDITDPDKISIEFISGTAFTHNQPSTLSSTIHVNCSNNYTNESSLLHIHPFQFPATRVTIHFHRCDDLFCGCSESSPPPSSPTIVIIALCNSCQSPAGSHGDCPSSYFNHSNQSCAEGREGILCGNCSEGYAVAINDPDLSCVECNSPYYGVAIFLLLQLVPVLIMLTLMAVLHIKIIDGHLSGFVLISQMVTLQFPGLGYSSWIPVCSGSRPEIWNFSSIPLTVYSIWNLNFLYLVPVPFCIPHIDTAAKAILLQYTTAACPLVFIVVTYTWIKCYNNGYRLVTDRNCKVL